MIKMMAKGMSMQDYDADIITGLHQASMQELIIMKIMNYYAATHTQEERDELEKLVARIAKEGKYEDQKKLVDIMQTTFISSPELLESIIKQQDETDSEMVFEYLRNASEENQIEILTYLMQKQKEIKITAQKWREYVSQQDRMEKITSQTLNSPS